jgi:hypothetical protein
MNKLLTVPLNQYNTCIFFASFDKLFYEMDTPAISQSVSLLEVGTRRLYCRIEIQQRITFF